jgi:hypothetical protein
VFLVLIPHFRAWSKNLFHIFLVQFRKKSEKSPRFNVLTWYCSRSLMMMNIRLLTLKYANHHGPFFPPLFVSTCIILIPCFFSPTVFLLPPKARKVISSVRELILERQRMLFHIRHADSMCVPAKLMITYIYSSQSSFLHSSLTPSIPPFPPLRVLFKVVETLKNGRKHRIERRNGFKAMKRTLKKPTCLSVLQKQVWRVFIS